MFNSEIIIYSKLKFDILSEVWLYFKPIDICQLSQIDKAAVEWCVLINSVVSQEFDFHEIENMSDAEEKKKIIYKIVSFFPKLSKIIFTCGMHNRSLYILYKTKSVCESIEELRINMFYDKESEGIERLSKLNKLNISGSSISIRGLERICSILSITFLDISYCDNLRESDLTNLCRLTNLASLSLRGNQRLIVDCGRRLKCLTTLTSLDLSFCDIRVNCVFLSYLTSLTSLNLHSNRILNDAPISNVSSLINLTFLDISLCNEISDIGASYLSSLTNLTDLNIRYLYLITDEGMSFLSSLTNITSLNLSYCEILDQGFSHLSSLHKLNHLDIEGCKTIDRALFYLSSLTNITSLNLKRCDISDDGFARISILTCMTSLNLSYCRLNDVRSSYLSSLTNLLALNCQCCEGMTDERLSHISTLTSITSLDLSFCNITDVRSLQYLTNITYLNFSNCDDLFDDGISSIASMTKIKYLNLFACKSLTDASFVYVSTLTNLKMLRIPCSNNNKNNGGLQFLCNLRKLDSLFVYQINQHNNNDIILSQDAFDKLESIKYFSYEVGVSLNRRLNVTSNKGFIKLDWLRRFSKKKRYTINYDYSN